MARRCCSQPSALEIDEDWQSPAHSPVRITKSGQFFFSTHFTQG